MVTVYALYRTDNGRSYIGCTAGKLSKRFREHRCLLNNGEHKCKSLQDDWKMLGPSYFSIEAREPLPDDVTLEAKRSAELKWIRFYKDAELLYNEHEVSFSGTKESLRKAVAVAHDKPGNRWTEEANEKRRQAQLGKPKGHGAKISATKRARNAMR